MSSLCLKTSSFTNVFNSKWLNETYFDNTFKHDVFWLNETSVYEWGMSFVAWNRLNVFIYLSSVLSFHMDHIIGF